jgi:hypothetical protein
MPMTVWLRHTNLYTCSAFRSFEQAQRLNGEEKSRIDGSRSVWTVDAAGAPRKLRGSPLASPQPGGMLGFAPFRGFIRGMSDKTGFLAMDISPWETIWRPPGNQR